MKVLLNKYFGWIIKIKSFNNIFSDRIDMGSCCWKKREVDKREVGSRVFDESNSKKMMGE
jgi:hypothetical protein